MPKSHKIHLRSFEKPKETANPVTQKPKCIIIFLERQSIYQPKPPKQSVKSVELETTVILGYVIYTFKF